MTDTLLHDINIERLSLKAQIADLADAMNQMCKKRIAAEARLAALEWVLERLDPDDEEEISEPAPKLERAKRRPLRRQVLATIIEAAADGISADAIVAKLGVRLGTVTAATAYYSGKREIASNGAHWYAAAYAPAPDLSDPPRPAGERLGLAAAPDPASEPAPANPPHAGALFSETEAA